MIYKDVDKLCTAINQGMQWILEFQWKREYSLVEESIQDNLVMTFCQDINPLGERLLKVKFYGVEGVKCDEIFNIISDAMIQIEDMSSRGYEGICYYVHEIEDLFSFYCEEIEYWYEES